MKTGRPSDFKPEYCEQIKHLIMLGAKDTEIAAFFHCAVSTLFYWRNHYPEFSEASKRAREEHDALVERSLRDKAIGYVATESKVFNINGKLVTKEVERHYPPDTTACMFWLQNRQPDRWRNVQHFDHSVKVDDAQEVDDLDLARKVAFLLNKGTLQIDSNETEH